MNINPDAILDIFRILNESGINYVLLRNIDCELPNKFKGNKDIDILVKQEEKKMFYNLMKINKWRKCPHPLDLAGDFTFLYAMDRFDFFTKKGINLDICYQLSCKSTNAGEWMPLDQFINNSVWENRKINKDYGWYEMSREDELVHLLTRCIFDKKTFSSNYIIRIEDLFRDIDINKFIERIELVFFKFTPYLLKHIENKRYQIIRNEYLKFIDY